MATGPGSINADSYHVGGQQVPRKSATDFSVRLNIGATIPATIDADGAISYEAANMKIDTNGMAAIDDLAAINGGAKGDVVTLRATAPGRVITVRNGAGNIHCDEDIVLDPQSGLTLICIEANVWSCAS